MMIPSYGLFSSNFLFFFFTSFSYIPFNFRVVGDLHPCYFFSIIVFFFPFFLLGLFGPVLMSGSRDGKSGWLHW
jgi:hypothetical protein